MSADALFVFHSLINFGLPLLFCWHQLRSLRRDGGGGRETVPEAAPPPPGGSHGEMPPKALPPGLVPQPSPFLPARGRRVLEDA